MSQQSLVFLIGGASLLALHTVRLWYSYKRGDTVTDDSGGDPYRIGLSHVLLALAITLLLAGYAAYGLSARCSWVGYRLHCD